MSLEPRVRTLQTVVWIVVGLALLYAAWRAISLAWVGDDAFISFRYARNLVDGHGLVYNVGETVEGYTNFLWTMLIAAGMLIGLEPVGLSQALGIVSYLATALILVFLSWKLWRNWNTPGMAVVPLAALAVLVQRDSHVYATSGLETAATTALVTLGFYLLVLGRRPRAFLGAGLTLVAAVMSRPDAAIFYVMGLVFVAAAQKPRLPSLAAYLAPLLIIYVPYWVWRFTYYGYPFPNTYYAKSAYASYYSQGLIYLWLYFKTYYVLLVLPLAGIPLAVTSLRPFVKERSIGLLPARIGLLGLLFIIPFLFYVARVGGDFMFARFLIPITPISFLLFEASLVRFSRRLSLSLLISLLIVVGVAARWDQYPGVRERRGGIADEIDFYPRSWLEQARVDGPRLSRYLDGLDVAVGFLGSRAMLMYYSGLPDAIECAAGLTDEHIAHQPIEQRGPPGHEKHASFEYLTKRGVRFLFFAESPSYGRYDPFRRIMFDSLGATIVAWDKKVMDHLRQFPDVKFIDFPLFLNWYLGQISDIPVPQRMKDFNFFRQFYFDHNDDDKRLRELVGKLRS